VGCNPYWDQPKDAHLECDDVVGPQQQQERLDHGDLGDGVDVEQVTQSVGGRDLIGPVSAMPALFTSPAVPASAVSSATRATAAVIWSGR